jgi:hypothetical protein
MIQRFLSGVLYKRPDAQALANKAARNLRYGSLDSKRSANIVIGGKKMDKIVLEFSDEDRY